VYREDPKMQRLYRLETAIIFEKQSGIHGSRSGPVVGTLYAHRESSMVAACKASVLATAQAFW